MGRYSSDYLDDACRNMYGHTNWEYDTNNDEVMYQKDKYQQLHSIVNSWWDSLPEEMQNELNKFYDNQKLKKITVVIFHKEPLSEEDE